MRRHATALLSASVAVVLLAPASASAHVLARDSAGAKRAVGAPALLRSPELWATIDVCNTLTQPDTVGIRGSMPGDGHARDHMFMRFALLRLSAVNQWVEEARSPYSLVGDAVKGLQSGVSFTPPKPKGVWRGVVDFKWMHGHTVVQAASESTTHGHEATAGAEPKGFSAANCSM